MNIRLILQDDSGKRFTLPVTGVDSILWQMEGDSPTFQCRGPNPGPSMSAATLVEVPAAIVRTIYRDEGKAPAKPRAAPRRGADPEPPAESS